jgi:hypothetical protein
VDWDGLGWTETAAEMSKTRAILVMQKGPLVELLRSRANLFPVYIHIVPEHHLITLLRLKQSILLFPNTSLRRVWLLDVPGALDTR